MSTLKLISWNVNGRTKDRDLAGQVNFLASRQPSIVALQEITQGGGGNAEKLKHHLAAIGLPYVVSTIHQAESGKGRQKCVMLASRYPLRVLEGVPQAIQAGWREKALSVVMTGLTRPIHIYTAHAPNFATYGMQKIELIDAVTDAMWRSKGTSRILCGDFNTPKSESVSGVIETFGTKPGNRQDRSELKLLQGMQAVDMVDVFRAFHGYGKEGWSHIVGNQHGRYPRRFDHIFCVQRSGNCFL